MGTPQAAVPALERLIADGREIAAVYTQPDRPSGRGNKITFSSVKEFATAHGLAVYQPLKIKTPEALEVFRSHNADVAVVVAYGRILPDTFLTAFPRGAVNVHFSLLPKYRGAAPVNWAIVSGESETGVTTMQMDAGLDTGAILLQSRLPIGIDETAVDLMARLSLTGADLLSETLRRFDEIIPQTQDHDKATLAPIMKREDGLLDWRMSAAELANRVRGFQPFPTAFTYFGQAKLTIWKAVPVDEDGGSNIGEVVAAERDTLIVRCGGDTMLKVEEIQPEGKRRMSIRDFLNGANVSEGDTFGIVWKDLSR